MRCEINKKKLLATTALGLVLAFGIGTTANMVSRRVEAADETGRGLSTIEGVIVQAENLVKETGSTVVMMDNDPNFIPEEDKGAELRGRLDDIKSDAAKFHQSGGSGAYERLNGMIEQAEEHLTRIQELIQGRPKRPADDAVLPPVDLRPSAAPPFDDAEDRVPVSEEDIRQRMQELDGRLQKLAVNFPRDPSTTDMESLRREIEDMWIEFRVIQQQVNTLGMNRKMDDAMQRLWNELERARMTVENIPEPGVGSEPVPQATAEELKNLKKEATQLLGKIDRYKIGGKDTTRLIEKVEVLEARAGGIGAGPLSTKEQGKLEEIKAVIKDMRRKLGKTRDKSIQSADVSNGSSDTYGTGSSAYDRSSPPYDYSGGPYSYGSSSYGYGSSPYGSTSHGGSSGPYGHGCSPYGSASMRMVRLKKFIDDARKEWAENPFISQNEARTTIRQGIGNQLYDLLLILEGTHPLSDGERLEVGKIIEQIVDLRREMEDNAKEIEGFMAWDNVKDTSMQVMRMRKFVDAMQKEIARNPYISQNSVRTEIRSGILTKLSNMIQILEGINPLSDEERTEIGRTKDELVDLRGKVQFSPNEYHELMAHASELRRYRDGDQLLMLKDDLKKQRGEMLELNRTAAEKSPPYRKIAGLENLKERANRLASTSLVREVGTEARRISEEVNNMQKRIRQHEEWEMRRTTTLVLAQTLIRRVSSEFSGSNGLQLTNARQCVQEAKDLAPQLRALAVEARNLVTEGMIGTEELDGVLMRATEVEVIERELEAAIPGIQRALAIGVNAQQLKQGILNLGRDIYKETNTDKKKDLARSMEVLLEQISVLNSEVAAFPPPNRFIPKHVIDRWKQDLDYASRTGEGCLARVNNA